MLMNYDGLFHIHTLAVLLMSVNDTYDIGGCLSHYTFAFGRKSVTVSRHGIWQPFFCLYAKQLQNENQIPGTLNVPASGIPTVGESVNALTEQVNNLQRRYYRALAPDCELRSSSDRWYLASIACFCATLIFPPFLLVAAFVLSRLRKEVQNEE